MMREDPRYGQIFHKILSQFFHLFVFVLLEARVELETILFPVINLASFLQAKTRLGYLGGQPLFVFCSVWVEDTLQMLSVDRILDGEDFLDGVFGE